MGDIRATLLDALAKKAVGPHSIIPNKLWHAAADEIERLRTERDTAFLEGVKAGLEAAARYLENYQGAVPPDVWAMRAMQISATGIRLINPATVTRKGGADG